MDEAIRLAKAGDHIGLIERLMLDGRLFTYEPEMDMPFIYESYITTDQTQHPNLKDAIEFAIQELKVNG